MSVLVVLGEIVFAVFFCPVHLIFLCSPRHTVIPRKKECRVLKSTCFPAGVFLVIASIKTHRMNLNHNLSFLFYFHIFFCVTGVVSDWAIWIVSALKFSLTLSPPFKNMSANWTSRMIHRPFYRPLTCQISVISQGFQGSRDILYMVLK